MKPSCCKNKSEKNIKQTVEFLKIISEENRLKILCILQSDEKCVCEIWQNLDLPQNLVSHHLKVLRDFGLVKPHKESTKVIYVLNHKKFNELKKLLSRFIK